METEGMGFPDMIRSSTEEMILSTFIENPIGSCAPNMEMLGYRTILQTCRKDSEELFNAWLMNGEIPGFSSGNGANHTCQMSRKISSEIIAFENQQSGTAQKTNTEDNSLSMLNDHSHDVQGTMRNAAEKSIQASNLLLAKAWFHSSQPMTRSRSSELRYSVGVEAHLASKPLVYSSSEIFLKEKKNLQRNHASIVTPLQY